MRIPSPAISIVGRHNSGKTTLIERVIAELVARGHDVASIKHHHHTGFEMDHPGKDSYRHRAAGASETVVAAPGQIARVKSIDGEIECNQIVRSMPNHDIIIVEGYRKSGLPAIEIMRAANKADARVAEVFVEGARRGFSLDTDFTQFLRGLAGETESEEERLIERALDARTPLSELLNDSDAAADVAQKMPSGETMAVVTDIPAVVEAAASYGIPAFPIDDCTPLVEFLEERIVRPRVSVVIQAGGESRRMGRSKATVPFGGRPMICRLVERLSPVADELIITTNEADNLAFLFEMYPNLNIKMVKDAFDFRGALPGLCTALRAAEGPYVAVVACDMVMASASLVAAEAIEMNEGCFDVVVPVNKHGFEPFHALYRKDTCLPLVEQFIEQGERRAQSFFDQVKLCEFAHERVLEAEPRGGCFVNANTPDELARLEAIVFDA